MLTGNTYGHSNTVSYAMAGVAATVVHDLIMNPAEVIKQRMQMHYSPYGGSLECVRCIYKTEGISAFYRSYSTQLLMNIPFQTVHFMSYEFWQQVFFCILNLLGRRSSRLLLGVRFVGSNRASNFGPKKARTARFDKNEA